VNYSGAEVCNTRYAMCALAFRGGLGNKEIDSLFADDAGDCYGALSFDCIRGIAKAATSGIVDHHTGSWEPGDVEDACLSLEKITIPESCSSAAGTKDLWKDPIAKCNVFHIPHVDFPHGLCSHFASQS
jgi:hypothetical protein